MSLKFYLAPNSTATFTVAIFAELEHALHRPLAERITLTLRSGDTRTPTYLSTINPNGRVPALVHDGVPIWESAAICMYLGELFGVDAGLYPPLGPKRGEAMKYIVWTNVTFAPAGAALAASLPKGTAGGVEEGSQDEVSFEEKARVEAEGKAREGVVKGLKVLEGALEGKSYLLGEEYGLVDTHVWAFVSYLGIVGIEMGDYGNVKGWVERIQGREALKEVFQ